jgi:hypothetical protein
MKLAIFAAAGAALLLAGCSGDPSETAQDTTVEKSSTVAAAETPADMQPANATIDKAALTADAKQAVMALGSTLKTQLQAAIKGGGPASAVDVCHKIAPAAAASLSEEHGLTLTRVSLRNRNPEMGVPNDWQTVVLQDFEARKAAGEGADRLAYSEVVDGEYRFMKAIPTEAVCLNCHGADIKPDVQAKIDALYPEDRAVGFSEGDLRGAFVAVRKLAE